MKTLNKNQKIFILYKFFKNTDYAGWYNIATKLLDEGSCVAAGNKCIWSGGIGNFIETVESDKFDDCLLYKFDLEIFLKSDLYKEVSSNYIAELTNKKRELSELIDDICENICEI